MNIDHIGLVVKDIDKEVRHFCQVLGYSLDNKIFDQTQISWLAMMIAANGYRIELIQPADKRAPSYDFADKGGGLHHICYIVNDLNAAIAHLKINGYLLIKNVVSAPLLDNRKIVFLFSKANGQIIELVEKL